jgi:hypothetical protein
MISCWKRRKCDKYDFDYLGGIEMRHGSQSYEILIFSGLIDRKMGLCAVILSISVVANPCAAAH